LRGSDAVGEPLQFDTIEDFGIDHADEESFDGALAEPVDDAFDRAACDVLPRLGGGIDEGAIFDCVGEVALLFETAQYGTNRGVFQGAVELFADLLGSNPAVAPDNREDAAFQFAEFGRIVG